MFFASSGLISASMKASSSASFSTMSWGSSKSMDPSFHVLGGQIRRSGGRVLLRLLAQDEFLDLARCRARHDVDDLERFGPVLLGRATLFHPLRELGLGKVA